MTFVFQNYLPAPLFKTLISQYIVSREAFSFNCPSHQIHKRKCTLKGRWYNPTRWAQNTIHNLIPWGFPRLDDQILCVLWDSITGLKNPRTGSLKAGTGQCKSPC